MASSIIHLAVANEINKKLKRNENQLLIGSIAPDISRFLNETKVKSHFLDSEDNDVPNIDHFLNKYQNHLNDDFVMGYFIHLYTDYLWFKYFVPEFFEKNMITKMDGTTYKCVGNMLALYIYNDYTNINQLIIDKYDLDLHIFYESIPKFNNIIDEIPMDQLKVIIDQTGTIIMNSKTKKAFIFDLTYVGEFIKTATDLILAKITELEQ